MRRFLMSWRRRLAVALGLLTCLVSGAASASEIWTFRFNSLNYRRLTISWQDDLIFRNTTDQDAVVRLLGLSNGGIRSDEVRDIAVPAGRTLSLWNLWNRWQPDTFPALWVVHVEVPDGVLVASRGGENSQCPSPCGAPTNPFPDLGAFTMPVFHSLVPAGTQQMHMGADLGTKAARFNVGLYNAGAATATATISVYQACDDTLLESRTLRIPANTAVQPSGIGSVKPSCGDADVPGRNPWLRYAIVIVDQPSVSYVINVAEGPSVWPSIPFATAIGF
jgi:hypothetical protein